MTWAPSRTELEKFLPNAKPEWMGALCTLAQRLVPHYGMDRLEWCHFAGQLAHESAGLTLGAMRENMNFRTPGRIREVYAYRLKLCLQKLDKGEVSEPAWARGKTVDQMCRELVGKPEELANIVYGGREGTPWYQGRRYIGRGPTQITHLNNYRAIGNEIARQPGGGAVDLVANPELLEQPEWGVRSAFADWAIKGLARYAREDDVDRVSAALNTGSPNKVSITNGLAERRRWTAKAKGVWPATTERQLVDATMLRQGDRGPEVEALQKRLTELGYPVGAVDGTYGLLTVRAVRNFQSEHGLTVDGQVGLRTQDALATSAPADLGHRAELTERDLADRGSTTVKTGQRTRFVGRTAAFLGLSGSVASLSDAVGLVSQARTSAEQVADIGRWLLSPMGLVVALLALIAVGGWAFASWADRIVQARVRDARAGVHLGR